MDEIQNRITQTIPASFEPTLDYVVTKIPRFNFEKFQDGDSNLTTSMKSVGEVMSLGQTFEASLQKALCSLDIGWDGLSSVAIDGELDALDEVGKPKSDRLLWIACALRQGYTVDEICKQSCVDRFFVNRIADIVHHEMALQSCRIEDMDEAYFWLLKEKGFSDRRIASLLGVSEKSVREKRLSLGVEAVYRRIDTVAGEF